MGTGDEMPIIKDFKVSLGEGSGNVTFSSYHIAMCAEGISFPVGSDLFSSSLSLPLSPSLP